MSKLTQKLINKVANNLDRMIQDQISWIEKQEEVVSEALLTGHSGNNGYNLRQNIQALQTGKTTLVHLNSYFLDFTGQTHEEWIKENKKESKSMDTPSDLILKAINQLIAGSDKKQ